MQHDSPGRLACRCCQERGCSTLKHLGSATASQRGGATQTVVALASRVGKRAAVSQGIQGEEAARDRPGVDIYRRGQQVMARSPWRLRCASPSRQARAHWGQVGRHCGACAAAPSPAAASPLPTRPPVAAAWPPLKALAAVALRCARHAASGGSMISCIEALVKKWHHTSYNTHQLPLGRSTRVQMLRLPPRECKTESRRQACTSSHPSITRGGHAHSYSAHLLPGQGGRVCGTLPPASQCRCPLRLGPGHTCSPCPACIADFGVTCRQR